MAILELVRRKPDWNAALGVAMARPPGVPERRAGEDPWNPPREVARPRRIADDLAWFRRAVEEPSDHGLQPLAEEPDFTVWESEASEPLAHLSRLRERGVLEAAGFKLHEPDASVA